MRSLLCISIALPWCVPVHAVDWSWRAGGSLAWSSDYVLRGVSQTNRDPAWQGDIHIEPVRHWSIGVWASTVRLTPAQRSTEFDIYLSKQFALNPDLSVAVTLTRYSYLHDPRPVSYAYDEFNVSLNWLDMWLLSASWSPDTTLLAPPYDFSTHQQTLTLDGSYHQALPYGFEMLIGAGYFEPLEQADGAYAFGNAGIAHRVGPLRAELNWFWTASERHRRYAPGPAGGPWALTLVYRF